MGKSVQDLVPSFLTGNENSHKFSDEFDFGPDQKLVLELLALE